MPSSKPKTSIDPDVQTLDAVYEHAGLTRNLRGKAAGITKRVRFARAEKEDLSPAAAHPRMAPNGVQWLSVPGWEKMDWLWSGFSTRLGGLSRAYCSEDAPGELNLGFTASDDRKIVLQNRKLFVEAVTGDATTPLATLHQIHTNALRVVSAKDADAVREHPWKADGLMTDEPGLLIAIQTADCIPVIVADRKRHAVAAFHAGWRGTVKRIVESGVGRMRLEFGSSPEDLVAAIGPGIGACCYAVGEEVLTEFESQFAYASKLFCMVDDSEAVHLKYPMLFLTQCAPGHSPIGPSLHLNLIEANRRQLLDAGLKPRSIKTVGGCTSCQSGLFFSYRASNGFSGRMLSAIGIRKPDALSRIDI
jgi:YfiH family protein